LNFSFNTSGVKSLPVRPIDSNCIQESLAEKKVTAEYPSELFALVFFAEETGVTNTPDTL